MLAEQRTKTNIAARDVRKSVFSSSAVCFLASVEISLLAKKPPQAICAVAPIEKDFVDVCDLVTEAR